MISETGTRWRCEPIKLEPIRFQYLSPKAKSMETLQANFLDQLQQMGSKYYKVLPVDLDPISSKKVKCHQKKQKC